MKMTNLSTDSHNEVFADNLLNTWTIKNTSKQDHLHSGLILNK